MKTEREIQIRPAVSTDLPVIMAIDHTCQTDYVWQMDIQRAPGEAGAIFREIRLPHAVSVNFPHSPDSLADEWSRRIGMLVAVIDKELAGYVRIVDRMIPEVVWVTDMAVAPRYRRQGVGTSLTRSAQSWAVKRDNRVLILEMTSKNIPAIRFAQKLGFDFCGYNDHYYLTQEVAVFFAHNLL